MSNQRIFSWSGRSHASTPLSSTFGTGSKYTYHDDKELENEFKKLGKMITNEAQAPQVKKLAKLYLKKSFGSISGQCIRSKASGNGSRTLRFPSAEFARLTGNM